MKKKLIFSSYDDIYNPYYAGGGAHAVHEIAKRLTKHFKVTVITYKYKEVKDGIIDKVTYKRIGLSFLGPKLSQLLFHALLPFYVKKEQFDIWIESFTPPFSTTCLQLFTQKPVIGLVHMLSAEDMERKYKLPFKFWENAGLKTYNSLIVLSEVFRKKIEQVNNKANILLIPNGVTLPKRDNMSQGNNKANYLLFLGRIEVDQKGLDLLVDAYKKMANKHNVRLLIAGSGYTPEEKLLAKVIKNSGVENHIILLGRVSGAQKASLLQNSSAVVISSRFETFSMVALEAMAYGKPLIHFGIEGLTWIPLDCSIRVTPFNVKELSKAMEQVVTDKTLSKHLSIAAKKTIKSYSWDDIAQQYSKAIKEVMEMPELSRKPSQKEVFTKT